MEMRTALDTPIPASRVSFAPASASRVRLSPLAGSKQCTLRVSIQNSASRPSRMRLVESIETIAWVRSWSLSSSRESSLSCSSTSRGASKGM